ncbi:MAG: hypothetical protein OEP95_04080 [Myxococcales bacterium]|nr:hypothetical protein [Myxococcales bacterium]
MIHRAGVFVLSALFFAMPASAAFLWGVTATDLVVIDPQDPSQVTIVGPHGLTDTPSYLAYHETEGRLFSLRSIEIQPAPLVLTYELFEYDLCSGAASLAVTLGRSDENGAFEALDYVDSVDSLVVSRSPTNDFFTTAFHTLDPDTGDLGFLADDGVDNDFGVHDDVRGIHYVWDPNNTGRFQIVDLTTGALTDLEATGTMDRDGAFSESDGGLFMIDGTNGELLNVQLTDGGAPITRVSLGPIAGDQPTGLAFTPLPPPTCGCTPLPGCIAAGKSSLSVVEKKPGSEKLKLSMKKLAEATLPADFGDPVTGIGRYDLCLYDSNATLQAQLTVDRPGDLCGSKQKPCWKAKGDKGFAYKDPDAADSGVRKVTAGSGDSGKGKLLLQAGNKEKKGQRAMPVGIAAALENEASAAVQVLVSDGRCFEGSLDEVKKADGLQFKAKGTGGTSQ